MKQVLINYMVRPEMIDENISLIRNVFTELKVAKLNGVKYSAYKMGENVFVHVAQFETIEAEKAFTALSAFKAFRKDMGARQLEKPITNDIEEIGSWSASIEW
jgi:hypothetical protein